ncbi:MAG: hypothetical protein ACK4QL_09660 [Pseudanabaenaceae cyanobacterium]
MLYLLLKVFVPSLLVAWLIKISAPQLSPLLCSLPADKQGVYSLLGVCLPVLVLAVILSLRRSTK